MPCRFNSKISSKLMTIILFYLCCIVRGWILKFCSKFIFFLNFIILVCLFLFLYLNKEFMKTLIILILLGMEWVMNQKWNLHIVEFRFWNFMDLCYINFSCKLSYFDIIGFICLVTILEKRIRSLNFLNMKMGKKKKHIWIIFGFFLLPLLIYNKFISHPNLMKLM